MQKRTRRPQGIGARKISISVSEDDLAVLTKYAKHAHGGNVSAVVHEMVEKLKRAHALDRLIEMLGGPVTTAEDREKLRREIADAPTGRRKRRRAA